PTAPELVLGTAQLGMPYGIANTTGTPDEGEAVALVQAALAGGIRTIDTARAYGDAELRVGLALSGSRERVTVVTKADPLTGVDAGAPAFLARDKTLESLAMSRDMLQMVALDVVLLHRASHRRYWGGAVWDVLRRERDAGAIRRIGVSVQSPAELADSLDDPEVSHVQLPFNLLDHRWEEAGLPDRLRKRGDVTVHARSVFLQGLLAAESGAPWPNVPGADPVEIEMAGRDLAAELGLAGLPGLALAYARSQDWIDGVVIGVETEAQLAANLASFGDPRLTDAAMVRIRSTVPRVPDRLLDPSAWPRLDAT
ncbi:aldo/keto reductase, partial [Nostoc sp. NIES-2111]